MQRRIQDDFSLIVTRFSVATGCALASREARLIRFEDGECAAFVEGSDDQAGATEPSRSSSLAAFVDSLITAFATAPLDATADQAPGEY